MGRVPTVSNTSSRIENALLIASIAFFALGLVSILAALIVGMSDRFAVAEGFWPVVYGIALFGLPAGIILLATGLVVSHRRRRIETHKGDIADA